MQALSRKNKGTKYIFTVIDVFFKYAWAIPVKNKGGLEIKNAFELLFQMSNPRKPDKLQTDAGKEFLNKAHRVLLFVSHRDKKAAVVERFNRTLKKWTYFTAKQTTIYIDKLLDFVKSYNHSVDRMIGMRPSDVREEDQDRIWPNLYGNNLTRPRTPSVVGKMARISIIKGLPNWSEDYGFPHKIMDS